MEDVLIEISTIKVKLLSNLFFNRTHKILYMDDNILIRSGIINFKSGLNSNVYLLNFLICRINNNYHPSLSIYVTIKDKNVEPISYILMSLNYIVKTHFESTLFDVIIEL